MDERYIKHRLYSTRLAAIVTALAIGVWFLYEFYVKSVYRWDLFIIMCLMAVTKLGAMLYYRRTN